MTRPRPPVRRIALAVALSVLFHYAVLSLPRTQPLHKDVAPALTVRLEPLAKPAAQPIAQAVPQPQLAPAASLQHKLAITEPHQAKAAHEPAPSVTPVALSAPPADQNQTNPGKLADNPPAELSSPQLNEVPDGTGLTPPQAPNALPKYAQLKFAVYKGSLRIGEARHQLEINGDQYTLQAVKQTVGLAKLLSSYQSTQTSRGKADDTGLQPMSYTEQVIDGSTRNLSATFDWSARQLHFADGGMAELPVDSQDSLSVLYQLSQLSLHREIIPLTISDGTKLAKYELEIGAHEEISTPMGKLRAVHLRQLHTGEEGFFEVWLGLDFRLLPVRILYTEPSGTVLEETVISDIFISDR
ncbi:MAG: DUF3108 domain-containing protein [Pseudomonadota bacterium]